jgi:hypothetical protein
MTSMITGLLGTWPTRRTRGARLSALLVAGLTLSGCGGTDDPGSSDTPSSTPTSKSASADPNKAYGLDVPAGIKLTALGTDLQVGQTAKVAWQPKNSMVGVVSITVTRLRQGSIKDFAGFTLDDRTRISTPYYVDAKVKNLGKTDLGGLAVPLYMVDGKDTLVQASSFQSTFRPCAAKPFPKKFAPGKSAEVCMVYVAANHGQLKAVSFRPTQEYLPIQWTGIVATPKATPTKKATKSPTSSPTG